MILVSPSPKVYTALLSGNVKELAACDQHELRPFLPSLVRMVLSPSSNASHLSSINQWEGKRKVIHALISGMIEGNAIQKYLGLDFMELKRDARKEQQLLKKLGPGETRSHSQSILASSLQYGLAIEFERSDHLRRFRLFLSEILRVLAQSESSGPFKMIQSDLFECEVHFDEMGDILCIAVAELPDLLDVINLAEALLCLERGPDLLAKMVANAPDSLHQVVTSLVLNGETLDEVSLAGRCRATAIKMLCCMHPPQSSYVQTLAVDNCKHPTLALWLALEDEEKRTKAREEQASMNTPGDLSKMKQSGVVTLIHNIIVSGDEQKRAWFSQYLKCMQQKYRRHRLSAITLLRAFLMKKIQFFFNKPLSSETLSSFPTRSLSRQLSEESMDEDSDNRETSNHSGEDNGVKIAEGDEASNQGSEKADVSNDTLEDLVDQMEIEISDHEDDKVDGATANKEDSETAEADVELDNEESGITQNKPKTAIKLKGQHGSKPVGQGEMEEVKRGQHTVSQFGRIKFRPISIDHQLTDDDIIELMELLQVCCALKTQAQMYLKDEEGGAILSVIVCSCPPFSPAGVCFVETTLCVLLACPFLISVENCEEAVVSWFKWLLEKLPDFDRACSGHCSYGELLLLIAIHLREKQHEQIKELIASTLNMKVSGSLRSGHFTIVRKLFLSVFSEDVVCAHAVSVPPTTNLNGLVTGYLPIHCVNQLVKTRTFRKHGISIKDWILQQLLTVSEPLHPILAPLLQEFVNAILIPSQKSTTYRTKNKAGVHETVHMPFSADEVLSVFQQDPDSSNSKSSISSQLLMLYYVLLYQSCYHNNLKSLLVQSPSAPSSTPGSYSTAVIAKIPIKHLLSYAQQYQSSFSNLYPTLLKLTSIQFPYLCLVCEWLTEKKIITDLHFKPIARISKEMLRPESAQAILEKLQTQPSQALLLLTQLSTFTPSSIIPYTQAIFSTLTLLLDPQIPRRIQDLYVTLWTKLNVVIPRKLLLQTVNTLRPASVKHMRPFSHQNIAEDPLIILRCDSRVFRCPPLFDILLRIASVCTTYSSSWLQEHAYIQNCVAMTTQDPKSSPVEGKVMKAQREELCNALIATQESALIQMLLEICVPNDKDKEEEACFGPQLTALQEIRCLFCSYLHHTFICEPTLIKLVHFQGYPTSLLSMMVSGVPSVHICLDFMSELLSQPQIEKQQFGVQLAAHLIQQYPLPEVMGVAEDIFKRLTILTNEIPDDIRDEYFLPLLPSIIQLCQTFPPLCSEATTFLVNLSKACESSQSSTIAAAADKVTVVTDSPSVKAGLLVCKTTRQCSLSGAIQETFQKLVTHAVVKI